jgi:hypothetical protein
MGIIKFPYNQQLPELIDCELCSRKIPPDMATLGPINAKGGVAIMCNGHLWEGLRLIDKYADYIAAERRNFLEANGHNLMQFGGAQDARVVY